MESSNLERINPAISHKRKERYSNRIYLFLFFVTLYRLLISNGITLAQHNIEDLSYYGDFSGIGGGERGSGEEVADEKYLYHNTGKSNNLFISNQKRALNETDFLLDFSTNHLAFERNKNIETLGKENNSRANHRAPSSGRAMDIVKKAVKKAAKKTKKKLKKKIKKLAHKAKTKLHHAIHQASAG